MLAADAVGMGGDPTRPGKGVCDGLIDPEAGEIEGPGSSSPNDTVEVVGSEATRKSSATVDNKDKSLNLGLIL